MNKFLTVMKFEYRGFTKSKSFMITTIVLVAVILIASFIPQIANLFSGALSGDGEGSASKAAYVLSQKAEKNHLDKYINEDVFNEYMPDYKWIKEKDSGSVKKLVSSGKYSMVFYYDSGDTYKLYTSGADLGAEMYVAMFDEMMTQVKRSIELSEYPDQVQDAVAQIMTAQVTGEAVPVGGDASKNYWYAYLLQFALYMVMIIYGQLILSAVMTEKSSKAMELLITSARPMDLMFGKVIGVGLVALTQILLLLASLGVGIRLNIDAWEEFMPAIFEVLKSMDLSFGMIGYFIIFFLIGYFSYAFLFAAFGSTVSKPEEASTISTMPIMILVLVFILSLISLNNMDAMLFKVLSYVPLFAPFIMFNRICMDMASTAEIWISIGISLVGLICIGWLAAKIYRVGIMIYGKPMSLKSILQVVRAK